MLSRHVERRPQSKSQVSQIVACYQPGRGIYSQTVFGIYKLYTLWSTYVATDVFVWTGPVSRH